MVCVDELGLDVMAEEPAIFGRFSDNLQWSTFSQLTLLIVGGAQSNLPDRSQRVLNTLHVEEIQNTSPPNHD